MVEKALVGHRAWVWQGVAKNRKKNLVPYGNNFPILNWAFPWIRGRGNGAWNLSGWSSPRPERGMFSSDGVDGAAPCFSEAMARSGGLRVRSRVGPEPFGRHVPGALRQRERPASNAHPRIGRPRGIAGRPPVCWSRFSKTIPGCSRQVWGLVFLRPNRRPPQDRHGLEAIRGPWAFWQTASMKDLSMPIRAASMEAPAGSRIKLARERKTRRFTPGSGEARRGCSCSPPFPRR